jgi:oxygen-dependent protoporphyrinogen oxidase
VIYAGSAFALAALVVEIVASSGRDALPRLQADPQAGPARFSGERGLMRTEASDGQLLDLTPFSEIRYPPVASVVLGFRREDVAHPCEGFGMLIPKIEGFKILGTIFSSSLFPNRAPAGHLTLTSYVGGERNPGLALLPADQLYGLTCDDLAVLLGVKGKPTFQHCVLYPAAIPQYNIGYGRYRDLMTEIETKAPGLFLAGHYRDGISVGDCIVSGCNVAARVAEALERQSVGASERQSA